MTTQSPTPTTETRIDPLHDAVEEAIRAHRAYHSQWLAQGRGSVEGAMRAALLAALPKIEATKGMTAKAGMHPHFVQRRFWNAMRDQLVKESTT